MQELGQLDRQHEAFAAKNVRIVAVSVDDQADTEQMQQRFPHLTILSDPSRQMISAMQSLHAGQGPGGTDVAAPTTFLIDTTGNIRYTFRPDRVITRLSPEDLLAAVEQHLR